MRLPENSKKIVYRLGIYLLTLYTRWVYDGCMAVKINISLSEELLQKMDEFCQKYDYERSEFVREAIRKRIHANPQATPPKTEIPPLEKSEVTEEEVANVVGNDDGGAALGTISQKKFDYCRTPFYGHPKGKMYQLTTIQFDDPNGNVLYKGGACPGCIAQYKEQMKKEGTLYIEGERQ